MLSVGMNEYPSDTEAFEVVEALTPEQAKAWRLKHPQISLWNIVAVQLVVGLLMFLGVKMFSFSFEVLLSVMYGVGCVVIPSALMARCLLINVGVAAILPRFLFLELLKVLLTVLLIAVGPLLMQINWLALIVGFVVTIKAYWVAVWFHTKSLSSVN